ncbi:hypothetical protein M8J77_003607 [Diaphorina citri]|nr:hypothetical protein M8J77_003607 [Diaphorina citri]
MHDLSGREKNLDFFRSCPGDIRDIQRFRKPGSTWLVRISINLNKWKNMLESHVHGGLLMTAVVHSQWV